MIFSSIISARPFVNKEFCVLVAVMATADSLRTLTPHNVHGTFFGALSASPSEVTFAKLSELQIFVKTFTYASIVRFFTKLFGNSIFL